MKTSEREYEFDIIIYATGFDAITGGFDRIEFRGRDGLTLKQKWADGPKTFLGLCVSGFPNMLTLVGPHNAATFCNIPRCIEQNVEWANDFMAYLQAHGIERFEATPEAEAAWTAHVHQTGERLLFTKVRSWFMGMNTNLAGKNKPTFLLYAGGAPAYREKCDDVAARDYEGIRLG